MEFNYKKFTKLYSREEQSDEDTQMFPRRDRERQYRTNSTERFNPKTRCQRRHRSTSSERMSPERKWRITVNVQQFRPEDVKVKVDPVYHTLIITAKRVTQPWQVQPEKCLMLKRVIPLPENIKIKQLVVKFTPRGELIVKAPYQTREDAYTPLLFKRSGSARIPISFKDVSCKRQGQEEPALLPTGQVDVNKCSLQRYFKLLKNTSFPNTLATQCVRDETTGKWKVIFDINTVGFRREEVEVRFQEKERLLTVEAKHEMRMTVPTQQGISLKTLRREFILPEYLDGKKMRYRIMNTGVLRIQLPCLRDPCPKMCNTEEEIEEQMLLRQKKEQQQIKLH